MLSIVGIWGKVKYGLSKKKEQFSFNFEQFFHKWVYNTNIFNFQDDLCPFLLRKSTSIAKP